MNNLFPSPIGAVRIIESIAATQPGDRVRRYPKRKGKTAAHWRRMDKKWRKRYGFRQEPCMYMINTPLYGFGETIVAHPVLAAKLRATLGKTEVEK
jgi:hypothetical protein